MTVPENNETHKAELLDRVRKAMRLKHYSFRTEGSDTQWIRRYILFHGKRHSEETGAEHVRSYR